MRSGDYIVAAILFGAALWALVKGEVRGRHAYRATRQGQPVRYWFRVFMYVFFGAIFIADAERRTEIEADLKADQSRAAVHQVGDARVLESGPKGVEGLPAEIEQMRESAFVLHRAQKYPEAIAQYDQAIAYASDDPQLIYWRAMARVSLGEYDKALRDFQRVSALDPSSDARMRADQLRARGARP